MEVRGPHEFQEEDKPSPRIHSKLASKIGIEYTVELKESNISEPRYLCVLCDKLTRNILVHWTSFNHRLKYLEKHYPTVVRKYRPDNFDLKPWKKSKQIVEIMADAIDNFHGRLEAKSMSASEFQRDKKKHTEDIINGFHYDERFGPNFLNVVEETLLKQNKSSGDVHAETGLQQSFNHKFVVNDSNSRDLALQTLHPSEERLKWEKYSFMFEKKLAQMQALQRGFDESPESHPLYSEEWDMFWVRRYKQLKAENKVDPKTYDYKPEWVIYWTKRMKQLFEVEVEKAKKAIKFSIGLPEDAEETDDQRYHLQIPSSSPVDDYTIQTIRAPFYTGPTRNPSRSRSPHGRDLQLRSRTRSRSRSPMRDYEVSTKNYQGHNSHLHSLSRDGLDCIDNSKDDYYKYSPLSYRDTATAGRRPLKPYSLSGNINLVPEQRLIDSHRESLPSAPTDRLEQSDGQNIYKRRAAYNTDDKTAEELLELKKSSYTGNQNIRGGRHDDGVEAFVANDCQIRTLAVIDRNVSDGGITQMNWKMLEKRLTQALVEVLRRNQGPVAQFRDAGWYQGRIKLVAFKDERSPSLYRQALKCLGQVWRGARLDLVALRQVPNRPRTFAQIPAEPSRPKDILEKIQHSNPHLPTHNWKIVKVSFEKAGFRQATITINGESLAALEKADGVIRYGSQTIKLRIYHEDA